MTHSRLQQRQVSVELCLLYEFEVLLHSLSMLLSCRFFWLETAVLNEQHIQLILIFWIGLHHGQGVELLRVTLKKMCCAEKASHVRSVK